MASSLTQRRSTAKTSDDAVNPTDDDTTVKQPNVSSPAPPQPLYRQTYTWLASHPVMLFILIAAILCPVLLQAFSIKSAGQVIFDTRTLSSYNGKENAPFYLAILGEVFDVTKGRRHYDSDKGYGGFVGRDASRAFVTGDFEGDLNDDVAEFNPQQCRSLVEWREFYHKAYTFKGRVVGRFYGRDGRPTQLLRQVEERAARAKDDEKAEQEAEAQWPACNVRWTESDGGSVWCDGDAYPRKVFFELPGGKPTSRCACFNEIGWSDVRQVYPDCPPAAHSCKV